MGGQGHQHEAAVTETIRWLGLACLVSFAACVTILPLMTIFRAGRRPAGYGYLLASFIFGASLWFLCALEVYQAWGGFAVAIGVLILGVGVVPMAFVALLLASQWALAVEILVIGALVAGCRLLGAWLVSREKIVR